MSNVSVGGQLSGWYDDGTGQQRWWDGSQWQQYAPEQPVNPTGPLTSQKINVKREAVYTRQQKGHSFILHWFVLGIFTVWIVPIYYTVSPNHYWHL